MTGDQLHSTQMDMDHSKYNIEETEHLFVESGLQFSSWLVIFQFSVFCVTILAVQWSLYNGTAGNRRKNGVSLHLYARMLALNVLSSGVMAYLFTLLFNHIDSVPAAVNTVCYTVLEIRNTILFLMSFSIGVCFVRHEVLVTLLKESYRLSTFSDRPTENSNSLLPRCCLQKNCKNVTDPTLAYFVISGLLVLPVILVLFGIAPFPVVKFIYEGYFCIPGEYMTYKFVLVICIALIYLCLSLVTENILSSVLSSLQDEASKISFCAAMATSGFLTWLLLFLLTVKLNYYGIEMMTVWGIYNCLDSLWVLVIFLVIK